MPTEFIVVIVVVVALLVVGFWYDRKQRRRGLGPGDTSRLTRDEAQGRADRWAGPPSTPGDSGGGSAF
jgi:FtsZ-interacting cell division protein ZipA